MSKQAEIRSLTGLRGIAALFVAVYHCLHGIISDPASNNLPIVFLRHGYLAVDLFFVLSGYVMALTYAKLFATGFRTQAFADFIGRRIGRIYPVYITVTLLVALHDRTFTPWHGLESGVALFSNALMIQSWGLSDSIVGPSWSISAEFAAYLLFPLLVRTVLQGQHKWLWISAAMAAGALLFIATRSSATLHQGAEFSARFGPLAVWGTGTPYLVLRCLAGFTLGLIAFRLTQHPEVRNRARSMFAGDIVMGCVILLMLIPDSDVALVLMFVPLVVTLAQQRSLTASLLSSPVLYWLGLVSYSLYLVHQPFKVHLQGPISKLLNVINVPHAYTAAAILTLIPALIVAAVSYYGIEKPGRTWSRHLFNVGRSRNSSSERIVTGARRAD